MLLILWRYLKNFFQDNFSEIKNKRRRYLRKTLKKYRKQLLTNLKKNILTETLWNVQDSFWKNLRKIVQKLRRNPRKNFENNWGALENLSRDTSKLNPALPPVQSVSTKWSGSQTIVFILVIVCVYEQSGLRNIELKLSESAPVPTPSTRPPRAAAPVSIPNSAVPY